MQIAELCHEIEDRDDALAKAREAAHKAQLQKYQAGLSLFILSFFERIFETLAPKDYFI